MSAKKQHRNSEHGLKTFKKRNHGGNLFFHSYCGDAGFLAQVFCGDLHFRARGKPTNRILRIRASLLACVTKHINAENAAVKTRSVRSAYL